MSDIFEVDEIIGSRVINGQKQYLVRWVGFDESEDSWEPEENLQDCLEKLQNYTIDVKSGNLGNNIKRDDRLSVTPPRKLNPSKENGVRHEAFSSLQESEMYHKTTAVNGVQTEVKTEIRNSYDAVNGKKEKVLDDSLDREIERITAANSNKSNSFLHEYHLFQCLKDTAPLVVFFFCSILIVAFLVPVLEKYQK